MPLHYGKIFGIIALLTILAFVLWQLWIALFAGEAFDEKVSPPHAEAPLVEMARASGCTVFAYLVNDPERYGVVEFDDAGKPVGIVEKPISPKSHWAVSGLYFYDNRVLDIAANLKPSPCGELEITDVNLAYLALNESACGRMGRGFAWLDTGTPDSILDVAEFVRTIEQRQGWMIACIEEIAYRSGFIDAEQPLRVEASLKNTY